MASARASVIAKNVFEKRLWEGFLALLSWM